MKYELIMGEQAATIEFADDMTVGELEVVKETLLKMLAQRTVELKKAQANSLPVTASIDSMYPALAPRTRNVLKRNGCDTIEDVLNCTPTDLKQMRNMGKKSLEEIEERFSKYGTFKETEANQ